MYKILIINLLKKEWSTGISNIIVKDLEGLNSNLDLVKLSDSEFTTLTETGLLEFDNLVFISYKITLKEIKTIVDYSQEADDYYAEKYNVDYFEQEFTNLNV